MTRRWLQSPSDSLISVVFPPPFGPIVQLTAAFNRQSTVSTNARDNKIQMGRFARYIQGIHGKNINPVFVWRRWSIYSRGQQNTCLTLFLYSNLLSSITQIHSEMPNEMRQMLTPRMIRAWNPQLPLKPGRSIEQELQQPRFRAPRERSEPAPSFPEVAEAREDYSEAEQPSR